MRLSKSPALVLLIAMWFAPPLFAAPKEPPIQTLKITEVVQQAAMLDGKPFKLKFYYRGNIGQIDSGTHFARVYDPDGNSIVVEFPKEGLNFFKRVLSDDDWRKKNYRWDVASDSSAVHVYVKGKSVTSHPTYTSFYTSDPMLVLEAFGKSFSKNISGDITYRW